MMYFVRVAMIAPGKGPEAMAFAYKVAKMVETKTGVKTNIAWPATGRLGRIAWVTAYENMGVFETEGTKLLRDAEYTKLVDDAAPLFMPGTVHDEIWTLLPPAEDLKKAA